MIIFLRNGGFDEEEESDFCLDESLNEESMRSRRSNGISRSEGNGGCDAVSKGASKTDVRVSCVFPSTKALESKVGTSSRKNEKRSLVSMESRSPKRGKAESWKSLVATTSS